MNVEMIKRAYKKGTRVKLIYMEDIQAPPVGTLGTISHVDDIGTIHVDWDNGSSLGMVLGFDSFELITGIIRDKKVERHLKLVCRNFDESDDVYCIKITTPETVGDVEFQNFLTELNDELQKEDEYDDCPYFSEGYNANTFIKYLLIKQPSWQAIVIKPDLELYM